jgi:predicted nucleic acid-binding protein
VTLAELDLGPLITFVTFGELATWAEIRNWGQRRREELTSWLSRIAVLPGDEAVDATWGRLSAAAVQRGRPRPVNDMWVAACCLTHGIPLATLNLKEDAADIAAAQAAMAEPGEDIPAEGVWAELGIADDRIGHRGEVYDR